MQSPEVSDLDEIYTLKSSEVTFYSHAPLEDIKATSTKLRAALNIESGQLLFIMPINSFEFKKSLMQKHFNEQYLESDQYPEAKFEGRFRESPLDFEKSEEFGFDGMLTIHGVQRRISGTANLEKDGQIIYGESMIEVKLEDYKIKIPRMVIKNIAELVEVSIHVQFIQSSNK